MPAILRKTSSLSRTAGACFDPDGDNLTYNVIVPPAHGRLSGTPPALMYGSARDILKVRPVHLFRLRHQSGLRPVHLHDPQFPLDDPSILAPRITGIELVNDRVKITWTSWIRGVYRILTKQECGAPDYSVGWGGNRYRDREWLRTRGLGTSLVLRRTARWLL